MKDKTLFLIGRKYNISDIFKTSLSILASFCYITRETQHLTKNNFKNLHLCVKLVYTDIEDFQAVGIEQHSLLRLHNHFV